MDPSGELSADGPYVEHNGAESSWVSFRGQTVAGALVLW